MQTAAPEPYWNKRWTWRGLELEVRAPGGQYLGTLLSALKWLKIIDITSGMSQWWLDNKRREWSDVKVAARDMWAEARRRGLVEAESAKGFIKLQKGAHAAGTDWATLHASAHYYSFAHKVYPQLRINMFAQESPPSVYQWVSALLEISEDGSEDGIALASHDGSTPNEALKRAIEMFWYHLDVYQREQLTPVQEGESPKQALRQLPRAVHWTVCWRGRPKRGGRFEPRASIVKAVDVAGAIKEVEKNYPTWEVCSPRAERNPIHDSPEAFKAHLDRIAWRGPRVQEGESAKSIIGKLSPFAWVTTHMFTDGFTFVDKLRKRVGFTLRSTSWDEPSYVVSYFEVGTGGANNDVGSARFVLDTHDFDKAAGHAKELARAFFHRRQLS